MNLFVLTVPPNFRNRCRLLFLALLLTPLTATQIVAQNVPVRGIPYTTDATGTYLADLYQPPTAGVHPAIVAIHGGSWRSGNRSEFHQLCRDLAAKGYACFSIDYDKRRDSFPISWMEARDAVTFLRTHAAEYNIQPHRIATLGTSAGGQIAALMATAPEGPDAESLAHAGLSSRSAPDAGKPVPVAAALLFNGGYDLHPRHRILRRYLGGDCEDIPAVCDDASPDHHVRPGAPPMFVGHGTHDHMIPFSQATDFVQLLKQVHDPVTLFFAQGAGHSYWRSHRWYERNLTAATDFLHRALQEDRQ